jgi:hypothetical protein
MTSCQVNKLGITIIVSIISYHKDIVLGSKVATAIKINVQLSHSLYLSIYIHTLKLNYDLKK